MTPWNERPIEVAHLLNPAFCGEIIWYAAREYNRISQKYLPFTLAYLILPIILHKKTRERINVKGRQQMHVWLQDNQDVKVGFAERARELVPIAQETLLFLAQVEVISLDTDGGIRTNKLKKNPIENGEVGDCLKKAVYLGRWLARAGTTATVFAMWGVRP